MKTTTDNGDAIASAMDWLGQLREDGYEADYAEPAFGGGGEPASPAGLPETFAGPPQADAGLPETASPETASPETASPEPASPEPASPEPGLPGPIPRPRVAFPAPAESMGAPAGTSAAPAGTMLGPSGTIPARAAAAPGAPATAPAARASVTGGEPGDDPEIREPAPIGDELRIPTAWCEMDSCISHFAHPAALGEVDNRSRAITAGWRIDALGRLACPKCLQGPWFWATERLARWDRRRAVAMATLMTAVVHQDDPDEPEDEAELALLPPVERALVPLPSYDHR